MNEKISQLIDQELHPKQWDELLEQISNNEAARKSWKCYHLIGHVMRGEVSDTGKDLATNISHNLQQEPTVLVPLLVNDVSTTAKADIWKSVGVLSVAASLLLVAVMILNPLDKEHSVNLANGARVVDVDANSHGDAQWSREFDEMLVNHAEFAASPGMSGLVSYAQLVRAEQLAQ